MNLHSPTGIAHSSRLVCRLCAAAGAVLMITIAGDVQSLRAQGAASSWVGHGPDGGSVFAFAIDPRQPDTIYAGTADVYPDLGNGLFKTEDGAAAWHAANNGLASRSINGVAVDPTSTSTVYAATRGGVFKSLDGAATWAASSAGLGTGSIAAIAIDSLAPTTLFASVAGILFKSIDAAASWTRSDSGILFGDVITLAVDPQHSATVYAGTRARGLHKSTNGGASWTRLNVGPADVVSIAIDPQTTSTMYVASFENADVFKSVDGGATFSSAGAGLGGARVQCLAMDPQNPATLYAGTIRGVYKTSDAAVTWTLASAGLDVFSNYVVALAVDPATPTAVYASFRQAGIFKSTNGGATWQPASHGLVNTAINSLALNALDETSLYAAASNGVHYGTQSGDTWTLVNAHLFANLLVADPVTPTTVFAATNSGLFKSVDGGRTWSAHGLAGQFVTSLVVDPSRPSTMYAGTTGSEGVFRTVDGGETWTVASARLTAKNVWAMAMDPQTPTTIYAGTGYNYPDACRGVFKSTDSGETWTQLGPFDRSISSIAIDPRRSETLYVSSAQWACTSGGPQSAGVFKSVDGGVTWVAAAPWLATTVVVDPLTPTALYAAPADAGVVRSVDGAESWSDFSSGLPPLAVRVVAVGRDAIYAGTGGGGASGGGALARSAPHATLSVVKSTPGAGPVVGAGVVTSSPAGVDCGPMCSQPYVEGTVVTLTATAAPKALFVGWTGCDAVSTTTCTVLVDRERSVEANFIAAVDLDMRTRTLRGLRPVAGRHAAIPIE
jgi:List-Bact-rpt repeat protein